MLFRNQGKIFVQMTKQEWNKILWDGFAKRQHAIARLPNDNMQIKEKRHMTAEDSKFKWCLNKDLLPQFEITGEMWPGWGRGQGGRTITH